MYTCIYRPKAKIYQWLGVQFYVCAVTPPPPTHTHTQIVLSQRSEILSLDCEMSAVHGLLSKLPQDMHYERLIATATKLFVKHPPKSLARQSGMRLSKRWVVWSEPIPLGTYLSPVYTRPLFNPGWILVQLSLILLTRGQRVIVVVWFVCLFVILSLLTWMS